VKAILIIDDEPGIRRTLSDILEDEHYNVFSAPDALAGLNIIERESIDLVFLDVLLPKMDGIEALKKIRSMWTYIEVVMISGHATIDTAVQAVKLGAFDFLEKPLSLDRILTVCRNALTVSALRSENKTLKHITSELIGESDEMNIIRDTIQQASSSDARILISGENGTGKELVARAIHNGSDRAKKAFVAVNCAAIPDQLIESELFGHEKGAFTDAISTRRGYFEQASGGTLFLDEIGDMSLSAQAKVLRALQEQKISRLGSEHTINVDVRIIAATNKNLTMACELGSFRQDLFFRLYVIPIHIPPLRERIEDIPILLFHFLKEFHIEHIRIDSGALRNICAYHWPGNVRELRNFAERLAVLHDTDHISETDINNFLQKKAEDSTVTPPLLNSFSSLLDLRYTEAKESFEKIYLQAQVEKSGGMLSRAAELMGLYPSNVHAKFKKYGIKI
jgi:two-component system nitrogen regulation response regulator NtrX